MCWRSSILLARVERAVASSQIMMRRTQRVTVAGVVGAVATVLLHSLFLAAAIWGGTGASRLPDRPDAMGAGANKGAPEGYTTERRMTVRLLSEVNATLSPPALLSEAIHTSLKLEVTGPDVLPLPPLVFEEEGAPAEPSDAELMARTKMVGIYESQIRARIERAWTLPAGYRKEDMFSCRVLIRQHRDGRIDEVEMPYDECDGSPAMRQALISAIFTASPLPAPPHPGVFVDSFSLVLRSGSVIRN